MRDMYKRPMIKCRNVTMQQQQQQRQRQFRSSYAYVLLLIALCCLHITQYTMATTIDLTTEYTMLSKSNSAVTRRTGSTLHHTRVHPVHPPLRDAAEGSNFQRIYVENADGVGAVALADEAHRFVNDAYAAQDTQHTLVALSSKSYISAPTTTGPIIATTTSTATTAAAHLPTTATLAATPTRRTTKSSTAPTTPTPTVAASKLAKRAGQPSDNNKSKTVKVQQQRNRTRVTESRAKLHNATPDHIPEPSGQIPYRVDRPLLTDYGASGSGAAITTGSGGGGGGGGGGGYHTLPYESDKWHNEYWEQDYNGLTAYNNTRVQHIEAECQDDYMKIRIGFNGTFNGLVYSAGYAYDPDCMYINGSGRDYYEFYIQLNRCGTLGKNALHEEKRKHPTNFMWNTVTVQYNPLIEEEYDEHFKVTCEYGYDFWKTVTFPFLDVEVATGNPVVFTLSPPECYMEIQNGYGIGGPRVTGPVRVGDPLTLIIYMRSKYDGFDIVVNDCYAHNGANKRIQLIDDYGCPVDDKLISRFRGSWSDSGVFETQVYAYMKTFRFTGSPALYIECDVRMCHGRCPSQPCHWRNLKAVTKRDLSNTTDSLAPSSKMSPTSATVSDATATAVTEQPTNAPPQSENINLFQSLRVLQEGESDGVDDGAYGRSRHLDPKNPQTCLKTSTFSALSVSCALLMCMLSGALMITCSRLKQRGKASLYDTYITHKGQID